MGLHIEPIALPAPIDGKTVMDCPSLSISYIANGLATVNFTIYIFPDAKSLPFEAPGPGFSMQVSDTELNGYVTEQAINPASEILWDEYKVTAICIGK